MGNYRDADNNLNACKANGYNDPIRMHSSTPKAVWGENDLKLYVGGLGVFFLIKKEKMSLGPMP